MTPAPPRITWPEGKRFAFTVFDDADYDRLDNVRPVYDFLGELGIHTTKSVWTLAATKEARLSGLSTELPEYLAWAQSLQRAGFEIGLHGVRCHSSLREETQRGLDLFRAQFGHDPKSFSNHFQNADSVYWGAARLRGIYRAIYRLANLRSPLRAEGLTHGHGCLPRPNRNSGEQQRRRHGQGQQEGSDPPVPHSSASF